jgi:hypothetical protein
MPFFLYLLDATLVKIPRKNFLCLKGVLYKVGILPLISRYYYKTIINYSIIVLCHRKYAILFCPRNK